MSKPAYEPLLTENEDRYVMFPIMDTDIWKEYTKNRWIAFGEPKRLTCLRI